MYRFETFELNTETYQLLDAGEPVALQPQVFDVLAYLIEHRNRVVPKEELLDNVWGNRFVSESALTTRIKTARRAVGDDGRTQRLIRNVHGRGYQFVGEVLVHEEPKEPSSSAPAPAPPSEPDTVAVAGSAAAALSLIVDDEFPFVGRQDLLIAAGEQLTTMREKSTAAALLIGGEPGIGKTRLAAEIGRSAIADGVHALAGRCDRHLATSLQPWLEAVGAYVQTASTDSLTTDTVGIAEHLRPVFPSLDARLPASDTAWRAPDEYAILDALTVLIERVSAHTPLMVVLDDVQWAGGATRALTSLLLRRNAARVLLVLTFRTTVDDLDDAVRDWLREVAAHPTARRIDLDPLDSADIEALVEQSQLDGDIGAQVWDLSEGHSLFAVELLRDARRGIGLPHLPDTVAALVRSRLDRLPDEVTRLVSAGAAIGPDFALDVAARASDLDPADALEAVETALAAELVHEVPGALDHFHFSHQLVPAAILDNMTRARRVRTHARLAEVIEERGGTASQIAHHLLEAHPVLDIDEVIERVRDTAETALVDHQYDTAAGLLARCAELPMDERRLAEVLAELGTAYNAAGRQPQALEPLERTAEMARRNGWPDLLAQAAMGRWGNGPFRASQDRTVRPLLSEAIELESQLDDRTMARLLAKQAAFSNFTRPIAEREALSARAAELVGVEPTHHRLEVLEARWMAIACPSTVHDIVPLDDELATLRKELGALTTDACAPEIGFYWRGLGDQLWELAAEVAADPRQRRDVDQWRTHTLTATRALFDGDYDTALELTDAALPLGFEPWGESGRVVHRLNHLIIDTLQGEPERSLETWREVATSVPSDSMRATASWTEVTCGDVEAARATLVDIAPRIGRMPDNFMGGFGLVGFGETAIQLGDQELMHTTVNALEPLADRMLGHPWAPSLAAADVLSRLQRQLGETESADEHEATALRLYEQLGASTFARRLRP